MSHWLWLPLFKASLMEKSIYILVRIDELKLGWKILMMGEMIPTYALEN